jgi:hypothetical protein
MLGGLEMAAKRNGPKPIIKSAPSSCSTYLERDPLLGAVPVGTVNELLGGLDELLEESPLRRRTAAKMKSKVPVANDK